MRIMVSKASIIWLMVSGGRAVTVASVAGSKACSMWACPGYPLKGRRWPGAAARSSPRRRPALIAARTISSMVSGSAVSARRVSSFRAMARRRIIAERASTMRSARSRSSGMGDPSSSEFGSGGLLGGAEPGGDDELTAVEIEIGAPPAVLPAARHEEEAAQGEIGEGIFAARERALDAGGQRAHRTVLKNGSPPVLASFAP